MSLENGWKVGKITEQRGKVNSFPQKVFQKPFRINQGLHLGTSAWLVLLSNLGQHKINNKNLDFEMAGPGKNLFHPPLMAISCPFSKKRKRINLVFIQSAEWGRGEGGSAIHWTISRFLSSKRSHISCTVVAPTSSTSSSATHFCASPIWNHKHDSNMLGTLLLCLEICSCARKDEIQVKVLQSESCWWHFTSMLVQIAGG